VLEDLDVPVAVDVTVPNAARMYDYYLGGANNFPADREAAEHVLRVAPWIRGTAIENRAFLRRVVAWLTREKEIRQFVDIGTGLPTGDNVHEIAHRLAPDTRVAYADNDPVVLGQSRGLLAGIENAVPLRADLRDPQGVIHHPHLVDFIDWSQPVALLLVAVMHFITDEHQPLEIIRAFRDAMVPGSYLVISHVHHEEDASTTSEVSSVYANSSASVVFRTREQITALFGGFELAEPGVVPLPEWYPEPRSFPAGEVWGLAGVARLAG
jgi:hypothetical protein